MLDVEVTGNVQSEKASSNVYDLSALALSEVQFLCSQYGLKKIYKNSLKFEKIPDDVYMKVRLMSLNVDKLKLYLESMLRPVSYVHMSVRVWLTKLSGQFICMHL